MRSLYEQIEHVHEWAPVIFVWTAEIALTWTRPGQREGLACKLCGLNDKGEYPPYSHPEPVVHPTAAGVP